ncbi:MAG: hypothetical protein ING39_00270 [Burkholderiales bacterium]|nr:hypothetical protein [Burkholderiales bacterium]
MDGRGYAGLRGARAALPRNRSPVPAGIGCASLAQSGSPAHPRKSRVSDETSGLAKAGRGWSRRTRRLHAPPPRQALAGLCAEAVGIADGVLWVTRDHLRLRRQYGAPLSSLQALQHRMADMFVEVELARSVTLQALQVVSQGDSSSRRKGVLAAHIQTSKSGMYVCKNGVQLHGALGVTDEHAVAGYFRRMAVISRLFGGTERQLSRYRALM